jgi:hypothetical protein
VPVAVAPDWTSINLYNSITYTSKQATVHAPRGAAICGKLATIDRTVCRICLTNPPSCSIVLPLPNASAALGRELRSQ